MSIPSRDHTPESHETDALNSSAPINSELLAIEKSSWKRSLHRDRYYGSLLFNVAAFILPALYGTLSKLWVANIDSSMVVTTDAFTYMNTASEAVNEGLPRAAWVIIGDEASRSLSERLQLTHTLIAFQSLVGFLLSVIFLGAAPKFADSFVPEEVRAASLTYVRITSFTVLSGAIETAVASATRALDKPDVPLVISSIKFAVNIILDLLIISRYHVGSFEPTVNMQGIIQLVCNLTAALAGLAYFLYFVSFSTWRKHSQLPLDDHVTRTNRSLSPNLRGLRVLLKPGIIFFAESAIRNALYLWLVTTVVSLGSVYATAWGVFNTIRWGLVMVPVQALEATSLQFIGHKWGQWRQLIGVNNRRPKASWKEIFSLISPALRSLVIALLVEVPIAIFLSAFGARPFALYISGSSEVADVTAHMWRTIDWCYIFYAMSTQLATILQATRPKWYLYQSLASNLLFTHINFFKMSMTTEDCTKVRPGFPRPVPETPEKVFEQFQMRDKVVIVTGAADGIGLAVTEAMAEAGANVALWYNSNDAAVEKAKTLGETYKIKAAAYQVDISQAEQVSTNIAKVVQDFGKIDVFVANAGMAISRPILEQTLDEYRKQMSVNVDGVVFCSKYAGEVFKSQGFGNFIITSSMSGHIVNVPVDQPVYNATKAFVTHFGKSLAREWREFARVNIVSPGFFDTKMGANPLAINEAYRMAALGRQGHVKEIKALYLYLASDASTYMTGSDVLIDGGYVLP
ncbi:putative NADP-dependent mannitol dehydrogenase [Trichoderma lentiforme]|uniref:NADP-dependent mannitol dehydrogenase n=1 Tax=Trichoderma lentiforme TaxID=1567552 RepID=A0A9P4XG36_9HYPO|nr:putative NADP-dependent mannitol dehydrogenase [Trichoderma lentiforme]